MIKQLLSIYFIINGIVFFITASIAMVRFPDFYSRLHAGSKSLAGGTLSILLAYMFQTGDGTVILKIILMTFFLLITNPIAVQALARTAYRQGYYSKYIHHDEYQLDKDKEDH